MARPASYRWNDIGEERAESIIDALDMLADRLDPYHPHEAVIDELDGERLAERVMARLERHQARLGRAMSKNKSAVRKRDLFRL